MRKRSLKPVPIVVLAAGLVLSATGLYPAARAQEDLSPKAAMMARNGSPIAPTQTVRVLGAIERSPEQMEHDSRLEPGTPPSMFPQFLPTMSLAEYEAAKANAASAVSYRSDAAGAAVPLIVDGPPTLHGINIDGVNQIVACGTCLPPDVHGAAGATQFVEVTNSHLDAYSKASPAPVLLKSVTLATFFGYTAQGLHQPRVLYDSLWNRWVITANAFPESTTVQRFFIAVSKTSDATGAFFIYNINADFARNDNLWDFPQIGMDQDAVIFTGNVFASGGHGAALGADAFAVAKAHLYNGLSLTFHLFTGLGGGTLAPPIVLDQSADDFLIAAPHSGSNLFLYDMEESSRIGTILTGPVAVPVVTYGVPPNASQFGTTATLETFDSRFINASTQTGNSLWQIHTINHGGFAAPRFYLINTLTEDVTMSGFIVAGPTAHGFNATIAATAGNNVFVTYNSTNPAAKINAQVRFTGRLSTDPAGITAGTALFTSPTFYAPMGIGVQSWGEYSAASLDPVVGNTAWIINEKILSSTRWGTRIGRIGFP